MNLQRHNQKFGRTGRSLTELLGKAASARNKEITPWMLCMIATLSIALNAEQCTNRNDFAALYDASANKQEEPTEHDWSLDKKPLTPSPVESPESTAKPTPALPESFFDAEGAPKKPRHQRRGSAPSVPSMNRPSRSSHHQRRFSMPDDTSQRQDGVPLPFLAELGLPARAAEQPVVEPEAPESEVPAATQEAAPAAALVAQEPAPEAPGPEVQAEAPESEVPAETPAEQPAAEAPELEVQEAASAETPVASSHAVANAQQKRRKQRPQRLTLAWTAEAQGQGGVYQFRDEAGHPLPGLYMQLYSGGKKLGTTPGQFRPQKIQDGVGINRCAPERGSNGESTVATIHVGSESYVALTLWLTPGATDACVVLRHNENAAIVTKQGVSLFLGKCKDLTQRGAASKKKIIIQYGKSVYEVTLPIHNSTWLGRR